MKEVCTYNLLLLDMNGAFFQLNFSGTISGTTACSVSTSSELNFLLSSSADKGSPSGCQRF